MSNILDTPVSDHPAGPVLPTRPPAPTGRRDPGPISNGAAKPGRRPGRLANGFSRAMDLFRRLARGQRKPPLAPLGRPYPWEAAYPDGVTWKLEVVRRPLFRILDDAVGAWPDNPCLTFQGKTYSYREVDALVARAAKGLQDIGVGKGVRVGLFLPNCPYFVIMYYAILKAGGTVVNFNPLYAEREIKRQIRDSDTRVMVTMNLNNLYTKIASQLGDTCLDKIVVCRMTAALTLRDATLFRIFRRRELSAIPNDGHHITFEKLTANDGSFAAPDIDPQNDTAVLQYTGGTTGVPKGAMLTHAALYSNTVQTRRWATHIKPGAERMLAVLPLFHVFGMTGVMNVVLYCGAELVLLPRFKSEEVLKTIDKLRPTIFMGVPTMYSAINSRKDLGDYDLSSVERCISGGSALPQSVKTTFERLTGCTLVEGYGLSEAGPVCTINPFNDSKAGSIGLPVPGTIIEIASLDDPDQMLPLGEAGEICISGPQVMAGYWGQPEETAATLRNGRLHTGDVGYMDDQGYIFLIDRIKDLIITGGFNVYPRMVEEAVMLHPDISEVAVAGVPHLHLGEIVKAFIVLRRGAKVSARDLRTFLKDKLAPFELPREVDFRDELPKTMLGKPLRRVLVAEELRRQKRAGEPPAGLDANAPTDGSDT